MPRSVRFFFGVGSRFFGPDRLPLLRHYLVRSAGNPSPISIRRLACD
jgi:hypothetical protein